MDHYFQRISKLSDSALTRQIEALSVAERRSVAQIIAHLAELHARKLHLELGYRGLFHYCVQGLRMTEGSAYLRIQVAKVCRQFPAVLSALADGRMSLTVAGKLAPWLSEKNCETLLAQCADMTKREVEEYLVRFAPKPEVSSGVRKQPPRSLPVDEQASSVGLLCSRQSPDRVPEPRPATATARRDGRRGSIEPCRPEVYNLRFAADRAFKDKLERLAEVLGIHDAAGDLAGVLESAIDIALEKKDPEQRHARRLQRQAQKAARDEAATEEPEVAPEGVRLDAPPERNRSLGNRSRYVPVALRDRLLTCAAHQCEYQSSDGRRCGERARLAIDHIEPFARGGPTTLENLRVLCPSHNARYAEQCYGRDFMQRKICAVDELETSAGRSG